MLLRAGAVFAVLNAALNHKATHRRSLWSQLYTKPAPNLPCVSPFNTQNVSEKINIRTIFVTFSASCTCYVRESLPNSSMQIVSQICGAENLTAEGKDVGDK